MNHPSNAARTRAPSRTGAGERSTEDPYAGPERRRHRIYVTRNTEYHFRDGLCIAVRDRRTGNFLAGHLALRRRVHGGLRFFEGGAIAPNPGDPRPGESLYFGSECQDLVTSALERIDRPSKELARTYPSRLDDEQHRGH